MRNIDWASAYEEINENRNAAARAKAEARAKQNAAPSPSSQPVRRGQGNRPVRPNPGGISNRGGGVGGANSDPGKPGVKPPKPTTSSEPASTPSSAPASAPKPRPPADHTDGMSKWAKANPGLASKVKPGQAGYKDINKSSASSMGARAATAKPQTSTAFSKPQMMSTPKVSTSGVKAPAAAPKPAAKPSGTSRIDAATSNVGKWSEEVSALGAAYDSMYQLDELMGAVGGAGAAVGSALGIGGAAGAGAAGAIKGKDGKEKVKKAVAQGTGAAVGGALGGPVGAVIGGGVGDAVSEAYAQWQEQNDKVQGKIQPPPGV